MLWPQPIITTIITYWKWTASTACFAKIVVMVFYPLQLLCGWNFFKGFKASKMLQKRVGASIVELLAFAWVQNFVRAPPPLSVWKNRLYLVFSADEANLTSLAPDSRELGQFREVLQTLRDFLQANAQSRWQQLGKAESVLQKLLTDEQGRALTHALWQTATH